MKQRLGVAIALLSKPQLLILDEPTNGLDPKGMIEMRELFFNLKEKFGTTILISSHLLSEIEKIVTHVGIIHKGSLKYQGSITELEKLNQANSFILIDTDDNDKTFTLLKDQHELKINEEGMIEIGFKSKEQVNNICKKIIGEGQAIYQVRVIKYNLEKTFLEMTKN